VDLSRFYPQQCRAITAGEGPLSILAGPGSGKTTTLAGRVAYLECGRRAPPCEADVDQVPDALLVRATLSVTAWLAPTEMAALRRESRKRGLAPSRLARDLIVSTLQSRRKEKRRGTALREGDGRTEVGRRGAAIAPNPVTAE